MRYFIWKLELLSNILWVTVDAFVKNLPDNDFRYLSPEFSNELLGLVKQKARSSRVMKAKMTSHGMKKNQFLCKMKYKLFNFCYLQSKEYKGQG